MNELVCKKDKFEESVNKLNELSKKNKDLPELKQFSKKEGLFSLFKNKVTPDQMNEFVNQVQENLIMFNDKTNQFYEQFIEIYKAFDSLDKEYIAGILGSFNQAIEATNKAIDAQNDINKTLDLLKESIVTSKEFNDKMYHEINNIKELNDVRFIELENQLKEIMNFTSNYESKYDELTFKLNDFLCEKKKIKSKFILCYSLISLLGVAFLILLFLLIFNVF